MSDTKREFVKNERKQSPRLNAVLADIICITYIFLHTYEYVGQKRHNKFSEIVILMFYFLFYFYFYSKISGLPFKKALFL